MRISILILYLTPALWLIDVSPVHAQAPQSDQIITTVMTTGKMIPIPEDDAPVIEIRSYNLVPGERNRFHKMVVESVVPLLEQHGTNLVAFGPSLHDENSYYLIRFYNSLTERERDQHEFYNSDSWRKSVREPILSMIETYTTVVIAANSETINHIQNTGYP